MKIRVAVFEDNRARRESLSMLIQADSRFELAGAFADGSRVVEDVSQCKPDVVLMDIQMPGISGVEAVRKIRAHFPAVRVMMQTVFEDDDNIFNSIRNGATGYILKKTPPERIAEAIVDLFQGGSPITPSIASKVLRYFNARGTSVTLNDDFNLTEREREILSCLVQGLSYKLIADACRISIFTVNAHIRKIYEKLHVHSATEAIAKTNRLNLLDGMV